MTHPLVETYATERLKTVAVWSAFQDADLGFRPTPRARTPREHMVHQCISEDTWMRGMLEIDSGMSTLPDVEDRLAFLRHYSAASAVREAALRAKHGTWWDEVTGFFDVRRSRAWIMTRRLTHSAHHRGQLTVYLRLLDRPVYSTYGPTADTGGLFQDGAPTIYRYPSLTDLLEAEADGGHWPPLPGASPRPPTERP